jgi:prepilin-type N-terminal cleavage/methylation domain-containing protein
MRYLRLNQKGFTLLELMIVVVILGILAAMAIPRFITVTSKAKQSEAKLILKQIYSNERIYFEQFGEYWIPLGGTIANQGNPFAFAEILVEVQNPALYDYELLGTPMTFTAWATANLDDDPTIDEWSINDRGQLRLTPGMDDAAN